MDARGRDYELPEDDPARAVTRIERDGELRGGDRVRRELREARAARARRRAPPPLWRSRTSGSTPSCARRSTSCAPLASGCSRSAWRSGAASSATCTTARSSGSCPWRSTSGSRARKLNEDPLAADQLLESAGDGARLGSGGAARAGARDPSGGAHRPRAGHGARDAREPRAGARGARRAARGAAPGGRRARGLLRGGRGAHERREVRQGEPRDRGGGARERPPPRGGGRRRRGRRRPRARHRPARPRRPDRGARGAARDRLGARQGNHDQGADPMR